MNYEESVRALLALGRELGAPQQARVQKFGLENIRILSAALGNPHLAVPCAHVAGTNGKGSTAAMLESILRRAGYRTGLYTSPHLERINERIRINGEPIPDEDFAAAWTRVAATIESLMASGKLAAHPTFFECVTATAFIAFQHSRDAGAVTRRDFFSVYEVGLGGRLDSTNIVEPEMAVITPIDFDHENFLGHSIEEIAAEKAGIIKPGAWVVSAPQRPEARAVIARRAQEVGARLIETERVWQIGEMGSRDGCYRAAASHRGPAIPLGGFETRPYNAAATLASHSKAHSHCGGAGGHDILIAPALPGKFQIQNALTAATAAILLGERRHEIDDEAIADGIASARWPGRLERLGEHPSVYLDGAHNPAAARELKGFWQENFAGRRIILVYGAMRDKAVDEIAGLLFPLAEHVILTQPRQSRAISAALLADMTAGLAHNATIIADPGEAFEHALATAAPDDVIFATGSLFLVGDLRRYWHSRQAAKMS
jgi:dihydrofolate synthase / folylpolyglutamate synthase